MLIIGIFNSSIGIIVLVIVIMNIVDMYREIVVELERERIVFNIIKDGDNVLRGAIGEKILEYLLKGGGFSSIGSLKCHSLNSLLFYFATKFVKDYEYIVITYDLPLENFIEKIRDNPEYFEELCNQVISSAQKLRREFGVKDAEFRCYVSPPGISRCYICNKGEHPLPIVTINNNNYLKENPEARRKKPYIRLCPHCIETGIRKGIIIKDRTGFRVHPNYLKDFALLWLACYLNTYKDLIPFIIRLKNYDFLLKLRGGGAMGKFDYICIDESGNRYLIDVKTTTSSKYIRSLIYKKKTKSKDIIHEALKYGFKVLIPLVEFLDNWNVEIKLVEIM